MTVRVRIAPSPTGYMHIGTARTALFNYLYAKNRGGQFLLRIEDTDRERSTPEAVDALIRGLTWLGLQWDGDILFQYERAARHAEVAHELVAKGHAYPCYATPAELEQMREEQKAKGLPQRYDGRWRDRDPKDAPLGAKPVIRLKAPQHGETVLHDHVLGEIRVSNAELDDMVLLRSDGSPTYMLAVVVDDHDMGITHVLRGQDHMTNTFRQMQIYRAMGWPIPEFGHIPLINGEDGKKLSKRHGALGLHEYEFMGYLPEAVRNYLLRLGWSHGDDEIITDVQAIEWFNLENMQKSPARFDTKKLRNLNAHYLRQADDDRLLRLILPLLEEKNDAPVSPELQARIRRRMGVLKSRAETLVDLADNALFFIRSEPVGNDQKAQRLIADNRTWLPALAERLAQLPAWTSAEIESSVRNFADSLGKKLGDIAQPLRAAVTGASISPPLFDIMEELGEQETLRRISLHIQLA